MTACASRETASSAFPGAAGRPMTARCGAFLAGGWRGSGFFFGGGGSSPSAARSSSVLSASFFSLSFLTTGGGPGGFTAIGFTKAEAASHRRRPVRASMATTRQSAARLTSSPSQIGAVLRLSVA